MAVSSLQIVLEDEKLDSNKRITTVLTATCTCKSGLSGYCTHVAVVLFALATRITKTELPTSWINPARPWQEEKAVSLPELHGVSTEVDCSFVKEGHFQLIDDYGRAASGAPAIKFRIPAFRRAAMKDREFILAMSLPERIKPYKLARENDRAASLPTIRDAFQLKQEDIEKAERLTRTTEFGRRNWYTLRIGRLMASVVGRVRFMFCFFLLLLTFAQILHFLLDLFFVAKN